MDIRELYCTCVHTHSRITIILCDMLLVFSSLYHKVPCIVITKYPSESILWALRYIASIVLPTSVS